ncbi:MAG: AraC family transcriptional regulator, partial [Alphaproteobacteria bacterium]|nr:AraC family transcriptional regulator [Alphaproteobacteria bacterium]
MQLNAVRNFSTHVLPECRRLDAWNALISATYQGMKAIPASSGFEGQLFTRQVGPFTLARVRSSSVTVTRTREKLTAAPGRLIVQALHAGRTSLHGGGGTVNLLPGDVIVGESDIPYTITSDEPHDVLLMEFDRKVLEPWVPRLRDRTDGQARVNPAAATRLRNVLLTLSKAEGSLPPGGYATGRSGLLTHLIAALFDESELPAGILDSPLVAHFRAIINARYADPGLSVTAVARELGVSLRTLQTTLARTGWTPLGVLLARRLDAAAEQLLLHRQASVTEIAFLVGFNDSAYFSRRFRI